MSRLIDADALLEKMSGHCDICKYHCHKPSRCDNCDWHEAMDDVDDMDEVKMMSTMNDYRPISDTAYDTATNKKPAIVEYAEDAAYDTATNGKSTIGALMLETLDMQALTSEMLCKIVSTISGDECTAISIKPSENLMSSLAAIKENQRDIMLAVKIIVDML